MARTFNKADYRAGMFMTGDAYFTSVDQPPVRQLLRAERKPVPPTPPEDPRVVFLQKHTASLTEIGQRLDALKPQLEALAAKVRRS